MSNKIKLMLVDDQQLFREALRTLLSVQDEFEVVGEASNGQEAIILADKHLPDVVLMDLRMPILDGVSATRTIIHNHPEIHVIILTTFDEDSSLFDGLKAGALGYLLKDISPDQLFNGIRSAARGEFFLLPSATARVVAEFSKISASIPENNVLPLLPAEELTKREIEILRLVTGGANNKQIAEVLVITEGTVKNHISNILAKLDAKDRLQAVIIARQKGIL